MTSLDLENKDAYRKVRMEALPEGALKRSEIVLGPFDPYKARHFQSEEPWTLDGVHLKPYGISLGETVISDEVWAAAHAHAHSRVPEIYAESDHYGLGYVILHQGVEAVWMLLNWWIPGDIRCQLMSSAPLGDTTVFSAVRRPLSSCIWEHVVIDFERRVWIDTMLNGAPDPNDYLRSVLADGPY